MILFVFLDLRWSAIFVGLTDPQLAKVGGGNAIGDLQKCHGCVQTTYLCTYIEGGILYQRTRYHNNLFSFHDRGLDRWE